VTQGPPPCGTPGVCAAVERKRRNKNMKEAQAAAFIPEAFPGWSLHGVPVVLVRAAETAAKPAKIAKTL
jgi:hypothetical protein